MGGGETEWLGQLMESAGLATKESKRSSKRRSASKRSSSKRSSKRRSKERDEGSVLALPEFLSEMPEMPEMPDMSVVTKPVGQAFISVWIFIGLGFAFSFIYVLQLTLKKVDDLRSKSDRLPKREKVLLMGKALRRSMAIAIIDLNPFWNITVSADVPLEDLPEAAIYMANHTSYIDPFVLSAAQRPVETKYVGKADLWNIPIAGQALHHSGDMPVHFVKDKKLKRWRTRTGTLDELMSQARDYLEMDVGISVFPEGSVSKTGELLPFKKGFFQLARECDVPIIPVGMWGNQDGWPNTTTSKDSSGGLLLGAADMHVHFGEPISPNGKSLEELMEEVYIAVRDLRNGLPNFNLAPELANVEPEFKQTVQLSPEDLDEAPEDGSDPLGNEERSSAE
ncbi:1-acyl-sn-glycerol-3-phosphate acyltransferase [Hondaea fermentalgiana]|uniref:1-acyl-sn-glycerol-3-phosphate acyltransferase n=1 Tax=Hondaea fermentalgiana TaxID=2315210 RepID=A0A2R5G5T8_9STRA|nr:1-acyl-sn-glycerol-3-phosphate acyltransferase [Hondaea fermentalgiana]|eukprot:GBG25709.1 1-acyl-sn-glycerol-3-phosphate acyltransferase [Hondaea fermentalgiana]